MENNGYNKRNLSQSKTKQALWINIDTEGNISKFED